MPQRVTRYQNDVSDDIGPGVARDMAIYQSPTFLIYRVGRHTAIDGTLLEYPIVR